VFAPALLLLQMVSYSSDIAPVLAFQCNRCHGDEGIAAGVDTRSYQSFVKTANFDLLMELLEGRRGESRRMPKEAPALDAATVEKFRRWIAAGAPEDRDPNPPRVVRRHVARQPVFRFQVEVAGDAYVSIELRDPAGRLLHREAGVVRDSGQWQVRSASHWPARLTIVMTARYAAGPAVLRLLP
jgi:cytochrome c553